MTRPTPIFTRLRDAQEVFGVSRTTMYRRAHEGAFPIYKRGNTTYVRTSDVEEWMESGSVIAGEGRGEGSGT